MPPHCTKTIKKDLKYEKMLKNDVKKQKNAFIDTNA